MSLIVQVAGGGGSAPPPGSKGGGGGGGGGQGAPQPPSRPPPAHVTQLTSSPATPHSAHLVQHHPPPAPHTLPQAPYPRALPPSPHRAHHLSHPRSRAPHHPSRMLLTSSLPHLATSPMPHLPNSPLPISPSPAHQLHLPTSINSPGHIPHGAPIPPAFLPRLPLQHLPPRPLPRGAPSLPTVPHPRETPTPTQGGQTALSNNSHHSFDSNILPPHAFRKLLRPTNSTPDDDIEVGETQQHPQQQQHQQQPRRAIMSPKHRDRKSCFTNLALQDHNYVAAPPPSPPRSPTPPPSPFTAHPGTMGLPPHSAGLPNDPSLLGNEDSKSGLSFGLASYSSNSTPSTGPACVGSYPSPHYSGPPAPQAGSPLARLKQTIEDAGVGPMTPLSEAKARDRSRGDSESREREAKVSASDSRDVEPDGGEETETAPEAEDDNQEDSITRCICDFLHDDGYMICCDRCAVWQHIVCMGIERNNIPEEYLCERCNPRPVDRRRAKTLQKNREKEIFARLNPKAQDTIPMDSSDDEKNPKGLVFPKKKVFSSLASRGKLVNKKPFDGKKVTDRKTLKKNHKRRSGLKTELGKGGVESTSDNRQTKADSPSKKLSPRKNIRRKSTTDGESEEDESPEPASLRSWIDNYEEAVTNHYSPELRSRLQAVKLPANFFKPKDVNGIRCNVSLRGNGLKVLTANNFIPSQTPIIECRGKYMLGSGNHRPRNAPYILSHSLCPDLEVVVDGKTYGNDSRYCRRADSKSGEANAVVRHHLDKGSLHLYIVASRNIDRNQEILLPAAEVVKNGSISMEEELQQMRRAEVRAATMVNGTSERRRPVAGNNLKRRVKRENVKKKERREEATDSSSEEEEKERPPSPRKTRSGGSGAVEEGKESAPEKVNVKAEVKEEPEQEADGVNVEEEAPVKVEKKSSKSAPAKLEIVIPKEEVKKEEATESAVSPMKSPDIGSPSSSSSLLKSPGKPAMGLPDQSGLIVGVNTINYDVSFRNKAKTREEKKMEMILKAIEQMERTEARKRNENCDSSSEKPEKKRRRSNSIKTNKDLNNVDSNLDASSADESCSTTTGGRAPRAGKGRGKRSGGVALRRRSRAKSGDSSALSDAEGTDTAGAGEENGPAREFKFPRHKRHTVFPDAGDVDDDVSRQYLRGSRSPPGIANHLLRSSSGGSKVPDNSKYERKPSGQSTPQSAPAILSMPSMASSEASPMPTPPISASTPGCSAKKRWLRAAMCEDSPQDQGSGSPSTISPEPDYTDYTPLKKRRLANYREAEEEVRAASEKEVADTMNNLPTPVNEKVMALPNGLKKRLISNLVLEAVLDRAMEDFQERREEEEVAESSPDLKLNSVKEEEEAKPGDEARQPGENDEDGNKHNSEASSTPNDTKSGVRVEKKNEQIITSSEARSSFGEDANRDDSKTDNALTAKPDSVEEEKGPVDLGKREKMERGRNELKEDIKVSADCQKEDFKEDSTPTVSKKAEIPFERCSSLKEDEEHEATPAEREEPSPSPSPSPPPSSVTSTTTPSVPAQHSVFKSFFSTDLSVEDIDRQLEARRVELAKEAEQEMRSARPGGSPSSEESRPGSSLSSSHPTTSSSSAQEPKKRVSLADYKKRKEKEKGGSENSTPTSRHTSPKLSPLPTSLPALPLPPVRGLPDLPGLESYAGSRGGHGAHAQSGHRDRDRHRDRHRDRPDHHRRQEKVRSSHSSPRETRPSPSPAPILPPPRVAPPPPVPDVPREDLTERLRKEFGLNIDESDGEDGETGGGLEALTARLQSAGRPEETKKSEEPVRHRSSSEGWEQKQSSHRDRGSREDGGKSRDRGEEKGRLKVEKTGRAMSGLPNQGNRSSRPRTPIGSPTRRASGEASFHGKERPKNYSSKNYFAS